MQNFRDYYQLLGVSPTASPSEIKTAYRRAARRHHPDLNPDDPTAEEKFKAVGEAYEILADGDRRNEYDQLTQFLSKKKSGGLFNPLNRGGKDYSQFTDFDQFVDYLLSQNQGSVPAPTPTQSARSTRPTPFAPTPSTPAASAPTSTTPIAAVPVSSRSPSPQPSPTPNPVRSATPPPPANTSSVPPHPSNTPSTRSPSPTQSSNQSSNTRPTATATPSPFSDRQSAPLRSVPRSPQGSPTFQRPNPQRPDYSTRQPANAPIPKRMGVTEVQLNIALDKAYKGGRERIRLADGRSLTVTLPAAMRSGQIIRVTPHEPNQDELSLQIKVLHHEVFTLKLPDIHCQIPVTPSEAVLGGGIDVPTLDGPVKMVLPAGVHSGQKLKLIGKGYPVDGKRGDQIVELQVQIPTTITFQERELYEKLRQTESFHPRRNLSL
ncbi:MAG: J domain-containing protein [Cyanothece sp. SIO2G6]|nr:J domain-containing protein [Cyanothece sp. SIO2G6]